MTQKTHCCFIGFEDYSEQELKDMVVDYVDYLTDLANFDMEVVRVIFCGSRVEGSPRPDSDLDVQIYYRGSEREDDCFNLLNKYPLHINRIPVDINPKIIR
jgi:predicted nucleotidyltransferase